MIIIVDSREQRPLSFGCDFIVKKLHVGDYGAKFTDDYQHPVVFERKSIADLFGTLTFGYDRFRRQIQKSDKLGIKMIIAIEGTQEKVLEGYKHSRRDPKSILVQLETIKKKYDIESIFFASRVSMAHYIADYYRVHYEQFMELI